MAKVVAEVGSTANQYQILAKLAAGGMAEIFLARGASVAGVERYCVLKRILPERASDAQLVQMFVDEARLAAQLQHPNIASVYDVGMLGDSYFFTMEYVHGETVRSLLQRAHGVRRAVPVASALTIIAGAAAGLHHAHERHAHDGRPLGIVHRDVSPSNLMISYEGHVKVVDFGVAKAADRSVETRSGTVKGKISYLSPEQCRGARVDRRGDLFSLGIVMWEMLTGARLYRRASDFENMVAIVSEPPEPPSARRPEVPHAVDDIVLRLLAKAPDARFQTAGALIDAIEQAAMTAGMILSTSAVGRLIHELFGPRAEPWLELATDTQPGEPTTEPDPLREPEPLGPPAVPERDATRSASLPIAAELLPSSSAELTRLPAEHGELPTASFPARRPRWRVPRRAWPIAGAIALAALGTAWLSTRGDPRAVVASPATAPSADPIEAVAPPAPPPVRPAPPPVRPAPPEPAIVTSFEALSALYEQRDWTRASAACNRAATTTGITTICLMVACHLGDPAQVNRWLAANPVELRAQLAASCGEVGLALAVPEAVVKPPARREDVPARREPPKRSPAAKRGSATLDCANDPLDCR